MYLRYQISRFPNQSQRGQTPTLELVCHFSSHTLSLHQIRALELVWYYSSPAFSLCTRTAFDMLKECCRAILWIRANVTFVFRNTGPEILASSFITDVSKYKPPRLLVIFCECVVAVRVKLLPIALRYPNIPINHKERRSFQKVWLGG